MDEKEKALRDAVDLTYAEAKKKFDTFTKTIEILEMVQKVFSQKLADSLYRRFMMNLCDFPDLTEDELIEKVLNDIKKRISNESIFKHYL